MFYVLPSVILFLCFFSPFSIAITSLGEERVNLSAFRTFVRFCACLDLSVFSSSWCLGRAAVCNCGTLWTFLLPFCSPTEWIVDYGYDEAALSCLDIYKIIQEWDSLLWSENIRGLRDLSPREGGIL